MQLILKLILLSIFFVPTSVNIGSIHDYSPPELPKKSLNTDLRIVSLNTWGLPVPVPKSDQLYRFKNIPTALEKTQADIICLQETFSPYLRDKLLSKLGHYNSNLDYECSQKKLFLIKTDCYGGLMTLSKFPVIDEQFYDFPVSNRGNIVEDIGAKGVLITTIKREEITIHIFNTHLYSGDDLKSENIRFKQIQYIEQLMTQYSKHESDLIILTGDLNIEHPKLIKHYNLENQYCYQYLTKQMCLNDCKSMIDSTDCTINPSLNPYTKSNNRLKKLDYTFFHSQGSSNFDVIDQTTIFRNSYSISDHLALQVDFRIN